MHETARRAPLLQHPRRQAAVDGDGRARPRPPQPGQKDDAPPPATPAASPQPTVLTPAERLWVRVYDNATILGASPEDAWTIASGRLNAWGVGLKEGDRPEAILTDHHFWAQVKRDVLAIMEPAFRRVFDEGIRVAKTIDVPGYRRREKDFLEPDEEELDNAATQLFKTYTDGWWARLEKTTQDGLRKALSDASTSGGGVNAVIRDIEPLFGSTRAKTIGVTETTRLFGLGAQATYQASGLTEWVWRTVRDAKVCPICEALNGKVSPMDVAFAPAHPNCRCFPSAQARRGRKEWERIGWMVEERRLAIAA